MKSKLFTLGSSDFAKGAISAFIAGAVFALGSIVHQAGFDLFTTDYAQVFVTALNAGMAAFVGYLGKNFISDSEGTVLGSADKK